MSKRASIPKSIETEILLQSGRRCCICFALLGDTGVKPGQIAHIDRDASNRETSNLAFLCLEHHDQYDSRTSQSKGFTEAELRSYRDKLYAALPSIVSTNSTPLSERLPSGDGRSAPDEQERRIYTELWNKLTDFRIAAHNLVDTLQDRVHQDPQGEFIDAFNAYQAVVRRNEPFIFPSVYEPARTILTNGRKISAGIAERMIKVDKERQEAVEEIDRLFDEVKVAIQDRTMPLPPRGSSS